MSESSAPSIIAALAAERHLRFVAEADHVRRLDQVDRGRGREPAATRYIRAVRVKFVTGAARLESWSARRWLQQWSLLGES